MTNLPFEVARAAVALNAVVLVGLIVVWGRNYRSHRAQHTLGLLVFAVILLGQNLLALYLYSLHPTFHAWVYEAAPIGRNGMMAFNVLELAALSFLAWITWK